jgi:HAMP domain-containing protein
MELNNRLTVAQQPTPRDNTVMRLPMGSAAGRNYSIRVWNRDCSAPVQKTVEWTRVEEIVRRYFGEQNGLGSLLSPQPDLLKFTSPDVRAEGSIVSITRKVGDKLEENVEAIDVVGRCAQQFMREILNALVEEEMPRSPMRMEESTDNVQVGGPPVSLTPSETQRIGAEMQRLRELNDKLQRDLEQARHEIAEMESRLEVQRKNSPQQEQITIEQVGSQLIENGTDQSAEHEGATLQEQLKAQEQELVKVRADFSRLETARQKEVEELKSQLRQLTQENQAALRAKELEEEVKTALGKNRELETARKGAEEQLTKAEGERLAALNSAGEYQQKIEKL